jgi:RNA polymerase sigma-70 factor (ECF subfamily)
MAQGQSPHLGEDGNISSEELACRAQAGSSVCFEELVKRYEGKLLNFLAQRTQRAEDAEDLLQETFARAYRRIGYYNPKWKFSTWLFTIASRLACNHRRKVRRPSLENVSLHADEVANPWAIVSQQEEKENLWGLAGELLSENQFTALWFRYSEGMPIKEIAKVMGKSQNNIKVLLFRSRSLLAKKLKGRESASG